MKLYMQEATQLESGLAEKDLGLNMMCPCGKKRPAVSWAALGEALPVG